MRTFRSRRRWAAFARFALRRASPSLARGARERRREGLCELRQRALHETSGVDRTDTSPDDGQEILSKIRV
jgi:hypothetical protein